MDQGPTYTRYLMIWVDVQVFFLQAPRGSLSKFRGSIESCTPKLAQKASLLRMPSLIYLGISLEWNSV
jgi:hypothetical protein